MIGGAAGAAYTASRNIADRVVASRTDSAIERAKARAREELDQRLDTLAADTLRGFSRALLVKALILAVWSSVFIFGLIGPVPFSWGLLVLLIAFVIRDAIVTLPIAVPAIRHVHAHRWRPKQAIVEYIAGSVFEQAYAEALAETGRTRVNRLTIAVSRTSREGLSEQVASAVDELVRDTSLEAVRSRLIVSGGKALTLLVAYSALIYAILRLRA